MDSPQSFSHRIENLKHGRALQSEAHTRLQPFNDDLSEFTSHEAVVLFAIDGHSRTASAITTVETNTPIGDERHRFRRDNIDNHVIDLAATAFGSSLKVLGADQNKVSWFEKSHMNPDVHMTWLPRPITDKEITIAAPQLAFNVHSGDIPNQTQLERIYNAHKPALEEIAYAFRGFEQQSGPLKHTLELDRPTTPNSFIIRWDLKGSTQLAVGPLEPILSNYLSDWKSIIKNSIDNNVRATIDGGDGQNIIIDIPDYVKLADPTSVKIFYNDAIQPILRALQSRHKLLSREYIELGSPSLTLAAEAGYVDRSREDYIDDAILWRVADKLKKQ